MVAGLAKAWRVMVFEPAVPATEYANVPLFESLKLSVANPVGITPTREPSHGESAKGGPVVR